MRDANYLVDVLAIGPTEADPLWTFVTTSMSERPMRPPCEVPNDGFAELLIRLPRDWTVEVDASSGLSGGRPEDAWPVSLLAAVAAAPHRHGEWLWAPQSLDLIDDPDAPDSRFPGAVIIPTSTLPEAFGELEILLCSVAAA